MDELRIESDFMSLLLRRVLKKWIKKKFFVSANVNVRKLRIKESENDPNKMAAYVELDVDISKDDLMRLAIDAIK